jgi:small-conductance mechanosensitive channel
VRLGQVGPESLQEACGDDPSAVCRFVYDRSESAGLSQLADVLLTTGLRILLIMVLAWVVLRLVRRAIDHFVRSLGSRDATGPTGRMRTAMSAALVPRETSIRSAARTETLGHVLKSIAAGTIWTVAGLMVLGELGINLGPLIAGAGVAGIAVGFGAQSMVKDFLAGIFILIEDQYGVGDVVDVGEVSGTLVSGTVESVTLRSTTVRSVDGTVWHVPNGTILRVGNLSQASDD